VSGELGFPAADEDDASLDNWIDEAGDVAVESSLYLHQSRNGLGGDNLYLGDEFEDGFEPSDPEFEDFFDPAFYGNFQNPYQLAQQTIADESVPNMANNYYNGNYDIYQSYYNNLHSQNQQGLQEDDDRDLALGPEGSMEAEPVGNSGMDYEDQWNQFYGIQEPAGGVSNPNNEYDYQSWSEFDPNSMNPNTVNQLYTAAAAMYQQQPEAYNEFYQQYADLYNKAAAPAPEDGKEESEGLIIGENNADVVPSVRHVLPSSAKVPDAGIPNKTPKEEVILPNLGFLVDPSPLDLKKEECITSDGEVGECHSAFQCGYTNGVVNGLCHQGMDASAHARVCCIYPSYCGFETNREVTYFKNPDYPNLTNNTGECHFRVNLLEGVCQLRVDFVELSLKPLNQGECDPENRLTISSRTKRAFTPVKHFCGQIHEDGEDPTRTDLNHVYIHVDDIPLDTQYTEPPNSPAPSVDFKVKVQNYPSRWNIRISQVMCDGAPLQSPSGCSQYYNSPNGTITSLNVADKSYQKQLKMAACIRTDPRACAIKYLIKDMQFGDVKNKKGGKLQLGYGLTCQDYIAFNGMKSGMCGSASNKEIIVPVRGPQGLSVVTDDVSSPSVEEGFRIQYSYLHQCDGATSFFKFPTAK